MCVFVFMIPPWIRHHEFGAVPKLLMMFGKPRTSDSMFRTLSNVLNLDTFRTEHVSFFGRGGLRPRPVRIFRKHARSQASRAPARGAPMEIPSSILAGRDLFRAFGRSGADMPRPRSISRSCARLELEPGETQASVRGNSERGFR